MTDIIDTLIDIMRQESARRAQRGFPIFSKIAVSKNRFKQISKAGEKRHVNYTPMPDKFKYLKEVKILGVKIAEHPLLEDHYYIFIDHQGEIIGMGRFDE
jgi:DNA polymerase III alpha subunit